MKRIHLSTLLGRGLVSAPSGRDVISMLPLRAAFIYLRTKHFIREETFDMAEIYLKYRALVPAEYFADGKILYEGRAEEAKKEQQFTLFPEDMAKYIVRLLKEDKAFQKAVPFSSYWELLLHTGRFKVPAAYLKLADRQEYYLPIAEDEERDIIYYLKPTSGELKKEACQLNVIIPNLGRINFPDACETTIIETDVVAIADAKHFFVHGKTLYYQNRKGIWCRGRYEGVAFQFIPMDKELLGIMGFDSRGLLIYQDRKHRICRKIHNRKNRILYPDSSSSYRIEICEEQLHFIPMYSFSTYEDPGLPFAVTFNGETETLTESEYATLFWKLCREKCFPASSLTPDKADAAWRVTSKMNNSSLTLTDMREIADNLKTADLWVFPCAMVLSDVLDILSGHYRQDEDLHKLMFRLLFLNALSSSEDLMWDFSFFMRFDLFIKEDCKGKDWTKELMSEEAGEAFKSWGSDAGVPVRIEELPESERKKIFVRSWKKPL